MRSTPVGLRISSWIQYESKSYPLPPPPVVVLSIYWQTSKCSISTNLAIQWRLYTSISAMGMQVRSLVSSDNGCSSTTSPLFALRGFGFLLSWGRLEKAWERSGKLDRTLGSGDDDSDVLRSGSGLIFGCWAWIPAILGRLLMRARLDGLFLGTWTSGTSSESDDEELEEYICFLSFVSRVAGMRGCSFACWGGADAWHGRLFGPGSADSASGRCGWTIDPGSRDIMASASDLTSGYLMQKPRIIASNWF